MAQNNQAWWAEQFIHALGQFMEERRLARGKSYNSPKRIKEFNIEGHRIRAKIQGNRRAFSEEDGSSTYLVKVDFSTIDPADWTLLLKKLGANAAWITKLLQGQVPESIESIFADEGFPLLPYSSDDFSTDCSCSDVESPCKHVAGVFYRLSSMLEKNPILLFEWRGMPRDQLAKALEKTDLGHALADQISEDDEQTLETQTHFYSQPELQAFDPRISLKKFWSMPASPETQEKPRSGAKISALLIKKQGDRPPFWESKHSFVEAMEQVYERIRQKNKSSL